MKRTILSLLIAGMFAGAGTLAMAQNVTAEDQAAAAQTNPSTDSAGGQAKSEDDSGTNTGSQAKSGDDYNAAASEAQATFTKANAKCDSLQGAEKTTCVSDAESARTESLAEAEKEWNSQNDQQSMNEEEDQVGDQAANQEGMTAPEDGAAATGTDKEQQTGQAGSQDGMTEPEDSAAAGTDDAQQPDQTGQAESQDGTTSDDRAEANPEEQDPDQTAAATDSAAPNSAELGDVGQN